TPRERERSANKKRPPHSGAATPPSHRRARRRSASRRGVEPPATAPRGRRGTDRPPCVRALSRYREAMLIYSMSVSVDGFIADREGAFGWGAPSDELFRFHTARVGELGGYLVGRR